MTISQFPGRLANPPFQYRLLTSSPLGPTLLLVSFWGWTLFCHLKPEAGRKQFGHTADKGGKEKNLGGVAMASAKLRAKQEAPGSPGVGCGGGISSKYQTRNYSAGKPRAESSTKPGSSLVKGAAVAWQLGEFFARGGNRRMGHGPKKGRKDAALHLSEPEVQLAPLHNYAPAMASEHRAFIAAMAFIAFIAFMAFMDFMACQLSGPGWAAPKSHPVSWTKGKCNL